VRRFDKLQIRGPGPARRSVALPQPLPGSLDRRSRTARSANLSMRPAMSLFAAIPHGPRSPIRGLDGYPVARACRDDEACAEMTARRRDVEYLTGMESPLYKNGADPGSLDETCRPRGPPPQACCHFCKHGTGFAEKMNSARAPGSKRRRSG